MGSPHHVNEREQHDPHQIHHVPVGRAAFDTVHVGRAIDALAGLPPQHDQNDHAEDDVHEMEEGERQVEHVEGVGRQVDAGSKLGCVFKTLTRANDEVVKFDVLCRLDTSAEVDVYKNGGILQKFAKDVIALGK